MLGPILDCLTRSMIRNRLRRTDHGSRMLDDQWSSGVTWWEERAKDSKKVKCNTWTVNETLWLELKAYCPLIGCPILPNSDRLKRTDQWQKSQWQSIKAYNGMKGMGKNSFERGKYFLRVPPRGSQGLEHQKKNNYRRAINNTGRSFELWSPFSQP